MVGAVIASALALADLGATSRSHTDPTPPPPVNFLGLDAAPLDEPLISDRPDFTESTAVVPFGHAQLEGGYTFTYDREDDVRTRDQTFPEFLLRAGLAKDWELRVGWVGWSLTNEFFHERDRRNRPIDVKEHDDAATDTSLGFKVHLWEQKGLIPDFGVIGELSIPSGATSKTSGDVDPQVKLLWSYELTERLSLSGNVNLAVPTSNGQRFFQTAASISLGCGITDWLGSYVEYFGFYPNDLGTDCAHSVNGGLTFLINNNLQFDVRTGVGLNEEADDLFTGAGFVIRW
jgi:Putative MetA-pathway of phenol degradation